MSDIEDEIEMILAMFTDECERDESRTHALLVHLPSRFELQVIVPTNGYPEECYPQLYVQSGPNAQMISAFSTELNRRVRDEVPLGFPLLLPLIGVAQTLAEEMKEEREKDEQAAQQRQEAAEEEIEHEMREMEAHGLTMWASDVITDRRSRFVAHMAPIQSDRDVDLVLRFIRGHRQMASAAHPAIYAYRYTDENGVMHSNNDDDGEHGAAGRIAFLLEQLNVDGYIVVVTRWFGGTLLGPDRFKHIMEVTKNILLTIPEREKDIAQQQKKNNNLSR